MATYNGIKTIKSPNGDIFHLDDSLVKQTVMSNTENVEYKILTTTSASPTSGSFYETKYGANLAYNPSTNKLSTGNLKLTGEIDVTGNAYLHNQTTADSLTAGNLIVNGNATFANTIHGDIDGNAATATKVNNNLVIKLKSGTTEGTDLYTFNGSAGKTLDIKQGTGITLTAAAGSLTIANAGVTGVKGDSESSYRTGQVNITKTNIGLGNVTNDAQIPKSIGTAEGDIIYWSAANTPARLGIGSAGQVLKVSSDGVPVWSSDNNSDTKVSQSETITANWRKVLVGAQNNATAQTAVTATTDVAFVSTGLEYQPSTGTLRVTKLEAISTQDLSGTANNKPALIIGGANTAAHMEIDANEIQAKDNGTTTAALYLNNDGGTVNVGSGGIVASNLTASKIAMTNANKKIISASYAHINVSNGTTSTNGYEELVLGNSTASGTENNTFGRLALYSTGTTGQYIISSGSGWKNHVLPDTAGWLVTAGNGSSTGAGAASRPVYISTSGVATQTTYCMAGTNTAATTGITYSGDLDTGIWYVNGITGDDKTTLYNQADGVIIANKYSTSWISEIFQDYRTGQLAIRGKNNGIWKDWRKVLDSTNYINYSIPKLTIQTFTAITSGKGDLGANASPRYIPYLWYASLGHDPEDGEIIAIKTPSAGNTAGMYLSINGNTTEKYHPIINGGTGRTTTHYNSGDMIMLVYQAEKTGTVYPIAGADATSTSSAGIWRVLNYYDSNTTYSAMSVAEMRTGTATTSRVIRADYLKTFLSTLGGTYLTLTHSSSSPYLQLNHDASGVTAGTYGNTTQQTPSHGSTFNIPYFTVDTQGHVTSASTTTVKLPDDNDTKNTAGSTDTSSKIFLIGATSQATNPQTYSDNEVFTTSGVLTAKEIVLSQTGARSITFSRTGGYNYIKTPATGGVAICATNGDVTLATSTLLVDSTNARPGQTNTYDLGSSNYYWKKLYTTTAVFNGTEDSTHSQDTNASVSISGGLSVAKKVSAKEVRIDNNQTSKGVSLQYDSTLEVLNFVFS